MPSCATSVAMSEFRTNRKKKWFKTLLMFCCDRIDSLQIRGVRYSHRCATTGIAGSR